MTPLRFAQIDAFASRPYTGNPAAVIPLDDWLDDAVLQAIAEENNLAETAFFVRADDDGAHDYDLRWFTPTVEIALCGHATLASGHFLLSEDAAIDRVRFGTRQAGVLEVRRSGDGYALDLPAWAPSRAPLADAIVAGMGGSLIDTLWHDRGYALLVYPDADAIRALSPDLRALGRLDDTLFIATAPGEDTDVISRVFAPTAGIDEDPVTGSAHAVLTPYWADRLGRDSFTAFQASRRGGRIGCRLEGDRAILSGGCVTVIEGRFRI